MSGFGLNYLQHLWSVYSIPGIHEVCCWYYCSLRANVQRRRCEDVGSVRVRVEKWKKGRDERREMDETQCREQSPGKAVHGTWSLMSTLTRIRFLSTDIDRYASATPSHCTLQLSHLVLSSFLFHSLLPIRHDQSRVPLQWHHFRVCQLLPSTAWLTPSAFVQHHPALLSTELQHGHTES